MIKHLLLTVAATIAMMFSYSQSGRVGIGTSNPEQKLDVAGSAKANDKVIGTRGFVAGTVTADTAKAIFSTDITNKGFYIPRLTTSQKNTLGSTLGTSNKGLLVFDTDLNRTDFWDGTAWKAVGDGAGGPPTGTAGGDLTGTYPNPTITNSAVTSNKILDGTITSADLATPAVNAANQIFNTLPVGNGGTGVNTITGAVIGNGSSPMSGVAASAGNQVLRRNNANTTYEFAQVQYSDVAGTPSALPPSGTAGGDLTGTYPNPTVGAGKIDNGKLANDAVTTGKILDGTITAADLATTGVTANTYNNVTVNSKGQVTSGSNAAYLTGNQNITLSGDVSGSGTTAISTTIGSNTVTNTKLSDMAQNTLKGRVSSGSGDPEDLTPAQALNVLGITAPTGDNLGNHTATTTLTTAAPSTYAAVTDLGYIAPIAVPEVNTGSGGFVPILQARTLITSGYRKHINIGSYRTGSGWGGGIYFAQGGNDNYPTEYFLLGNGGSIGHSSGNITMSGNVGIGISPTTALDVNGAARIRSLGTGFVKSDASGNLSVSSIALGDLPPHTHGAADIVSGELNYARVRELISKDTRSTNPDPQSFNPAFSADFKQNSTNGLADGGTYNGVLSFRPYGGGTDFSGGPMHQLGFTDNGNLWMRTSTGNTTWGNWKNISVMRYATNHSFNIPSYNGGVTYKTWWFPMEGAEGTDDAITMGRPQTMVAPYGGRLVKIIIVADETSSNSGVEISNATFALSVNQSDYSSPTPTYVGSTLFSINEGGSYTFNVPSNWTFTEGSRLRVGLRFNGTAGYVEDNDYFVTCVWEYNQ